MVVQPELSRHLMGLGLGKPEADAYVQLLRLAAEEPVSGYAVAKALRKDPTSVYKALDELARLGAVEVARGRGRLYRPADPEDLTHRLVERVRRRAEEAAAALSRLRVERTDDHVYSLTDRAQALDRCREILGATRQVALLDLAPALVDELAEAVAAAAGRGAAVAVRTYGPVELPGAEVIVDPDGALLLELMPGPLAHCVGDCRRLLSAYLAQDPRQDRCQAIWTASPFLGYQAHNGLAAEIIHAELRRLLRAAAGADAMQARQDELARLLHGRIDWEQLWRDMGVPRLSGRPDAPAVGRTPLGVAEPALPWRAQDPVLADIARRKRRFQLEDAAPDEEERR